MARKDSDHQKKSMSLLFRGKAIFKPLNTGRIDEHVACVREWVANIYFYTKNNVTIMIDAGYNYARLREKMGWLDIDPSTIQHILITHQDTDHVGALETDSEQLFRDATVYIGEIENRYLTGETRRKVFHGLYKLPMVRMENKKVLLRDGEVFQIGDISLHRRHDLVRGGRRLQLYRHAGRGQQAGGPFAGKAGEGTPQTKQSSEDHHRAHRLDGRSRLCIPPQKRIM